MNQVLEQLSGGQIVGLIAIIVGTLGVVTVAVSAILIPQWRGVRQAEAEALLKKELLDRGFSAEEIERVVQATALRPGQRPAAAPSSDTARRQSAKDGKATAADWAVVNRLPS